MSYRPETLNRAASCERKNQVMRRLRSLGTFSLYVLGQLLLMFAGWVDMQDIGHGVFSGGSGCHCSKNSVTHRDCEFNQTTPDNTQREHMPKCGVMPCRIYVTLYSGKKLSGTILRQELYLRDHTMVIIIGP